MLTIGSGIASPDPSAVETFPSSTKSLALDGAGDYATFSSTAFEIGSAAVQLSIVFWAKRTDNNDIAVVLASGAGLSTKRLNFGADGTTLEMEGDTNGQSATGNVTADTDWHHYAVTVKGKDGGAQAVIEMYEDGQTINATNTNLGASSADFTVSQIGTNHDGTGTTNEFKGLLYDLAIYNRVLTPLHIIHLASDSTIPLQSNQGNYTASTYLIHYWKFEGLIDVKGGLDITLVGDAAASSTLPA
tara:strand:+ start:630 stop:1364 length:735 start_codon:yes stop_codon:yes gene_type:complete